MDMEHSPAKRVFYYFEQLSRIPRGSGNTKAVSDYCAAFAREHGLEYYQDKWNNVIIIREASAGYETHKPYIIQGHLDMVCEKEKGYDIDFETEGLQIFEENGYIRARGTTLGADDGIAVAYALALLEMPDLKSPRLEAVFTVDEETGMDGAKEIDLSVLKGRHMLNLDSEEEGIFLCGCAGGMCVSSDFSLTREKKYGFLVKLTVTGLEGGHSGSEIDKEHANGVTVLGRVLKALEKRNIPTDLVEIEGGLKDNAIPREAYATLFFHGEEKIIDLCKEEISRLDKILKKEYEGSDPGISLVIEWKNVQTEAQVIRESRTITDFLFLAPNGVRHMSMDIPGMVETSLNLGIMFASEDTFHVSFSVRSSVGSRKQELAHKIAVLTRLLGGRCSFSGEYPAWEYKRDSVLRERMKETWKKVTGQDPQITVIHAGLECGLFMEKLPDLDCVSFGPQIDDIHTPKEKLNIHSTELVWKFILELLKKGNL